MQNKEIEKVTEKDDVTFSHDELINLLQETYECGWRDGLKFRLFVRNPEEILHEIVKQNKTQMEAKG